MSQFGQISPIQITEINRNLARIAKSLEQLAAIAKREEDEANRAKLTPRRPMQAPPR